MDILHHMMAIPLRIHIHQKRHSEQLQRRGLEKSLMKMVTDHQRLLLNCIKVTVQSHIEQMV